MASSSAIPQALGQLVIVEHADARDPTSWKSVLASASGAPASYTTVKTLVYKPKSKGTVVPVVVVVHEDTDIISGALAKKLNLKEMRFAADDLYQEFFAASKDEGKILPRWPLPCY